MKTQLNAAAYIVLAALIVCIFSILTLAQSPAQPSPSPTPLILGPVNVLTPSPTPTPPDDPRPPICSAPYQPGFTPHIIRPGERLADLMAGVLNLTVTQVIALNCLDDASTLPVGGVIWLPEANPLISDQPFDSDSNVDKAEIISLTSSAENIQNLAPVSFTWEAHGSAAYFYLCNPDPALECIRPAQTQPVPLSYTTPSITNFRYAAPMRYRLEVVDGNARATEDITLQVTCSQTPLGQYTGLVPCPDAPPHTVTAAWQSFQGGYMIWFSDTYKIWVMTREDHQIQVFNDTYREGEAQPTATAPNGLLVPIRGFGKIWLALGGAESALGWATAPESGIDIAQQPAGRVSYTTYLQPQGAPVFAVTLLPDESNGWWIQLNPG